MLGAGCWLMRCCVLGAGWALVVVVLGAWRRGGVGRGFMGVGCGFCE